MLSFSEKERKIIQASTQQSLAAELDKRREMLKENISKKYRSMIDKCKAIQAQNIETKVTNLREVATKIINGNNLLEENTRALKKAQSAMEDLVLLLKLIRALLDRDESLYEKMKRLKFVREKKDHFKHHNFYRKIEKTYKDRLCSLSKQVEFEIENWKGCIKTRSKEISREILKKTSNAERKGKSLIFNEIYTIRPLLDLKRVLVPFYIAKAFNFSVNPFSELFSTEAEVLSFALCFLFLKEKEFVQVEFDYEQLNVHMARTVKKLFEMVGDDCTEIEKEEKTLSTKFLQEKEPVLEEDGVEEYVKTCAETGHYQAQAEIIDSYLCKRLVGLEENLNEALETSAEGEDNKEIHHTVEEIQKQLGWLKIQNASFKAHDWNTEILAKKFKERIAKNVFQNKKRAICAIFETEDFALKIIQELQGVEKDVVEMLSTVISEKYSEKMGEDPKTRRKVIGDALVLVKYYRDNEIRAGDLEDLVL